MKKFILIIFPVLFFGCAFAQRTPSNSTLLCDDHGQHCAYRSNEEMKTILALKENEKKLNSNKAPMDDGHIQVGKCYFSYPFGCVVNQKIDDHHLGLVCRGGSYAGYVIQEPGNNQHAILEVEQIRFYGIGPINTGFQFVGTKTLKLDNGFDAVFDLWKECQPKSP